MIPPGSNTFRSEAPSHAEVVDSLPHIVWTAQPDGQVDWLSREFEQYTGISGARNVQSGWMQAIHVEDRDKLKESWTESTESAHSYKTEVRVWSDRSKDWRVNMVSARAQVSPEGEVIRWFGTVTDIQSLYDAEAERAYELKIRKLESEVLRAIGTGGTLHQIFTLICCKVEELLPDARTVITRITPDGCLGDGFSIRMPVAFMDSCKGIPIGPKSGTCGTAAFRRDLVVIEDTLTDPLWEDCRDLAITFGLRSSIACPVLDEAGNSVATLALHFPDPFRPTSTESLTARRLAEFVFLALSATRDRELLLQSEARYRSLFNLMPVSVWEEDISAVLEELEALRQTGVSDFRAWLKGNAEFIARMIGKIRIIGVNQTTLALHAVAVSVRGAGVISLPPAV
jgi:PAS domain S-box-containing protein